MGKEKKKSQPHTLISPFKWTYYFKQHVQQKYASWFMGFFESQWQNDKIYYYFFSFIFISWRLIILQYCSGFCHTLTWISRGFTCIPDPDPPSHLHLYKIYYYFWECPYNVNYHFNTYDYNTTAFYNTLTMWQ